MDRFAQHDGLELLSQENWEEGKRIELADAPYRLQLIVVCSSLGRRKALFADGEFHPYFCFMGYRRPNGAMYAEGGVIIPVLPTEQLLMVVEQRGPLALFPDRPTLLHLRSGDIDLARFGAHSSLEFPGGSVEIGAGFKASFLHELEEETGAGAGRVYQRRNPHYQFVCDVAARDYFAVVFLEHMHYVRKTKNDGGLTVLALWPDEVLANIRSGAIASAHAALLPYTFYCEITEARDKGTLSRLIDERYVETGSVRVSL